MLARGGEIRPWLGVSLSTVTAWVALRNNLAVDKGAIIAEVNPDSPADNAGLREGDIIVSIDGTEISTAQKLIKVIHSRQIGQEIEITYWRGEDKYTTTAILIERPAS